MSARRSPASFGAFCPLAARRGKDYTRRMRIPISLGLALLLATEAAAQNPFEWAKDRAEDGLAAARNVKDLVGARIQDGAKWIGDRREDAIREATVTACRQIYKDWSKRIHRTGTRVELSERHRAYLQAEYGVELFERVRVFDLAKMQRNLRLPIVLPPGFVFHVDVPIGVEAGAQTFGTDVFLRDAYDPASDEQLSLLAHEYDHASASVSLDFQRVYCEEIYRGVRERGPGAGEAIYFGNALEKRAYEHQRDFSCRSGAPRPWYLPYQLEKAGLGAECPRVEPAGEAAQAGGAGAELTGGGPAPEPAENVGAEPSGGGAAPY